MNKDLILAMGAEHTNPERLKQIIGFVNSDRIGYRAGNISDKTFSHLYDIYGVEPNNDYREMRYVVEEKFDGYSYLNQGGEFYSKRLSAAKGNEGQPVCKSDSIHITPLLRRVYEMCGANLHGELYVPGGISDDVTKILGCTPEKNATPNATIKKIERKRCRVFLISIQISLYKAFFDIVLSNLP